MTGTEPFQDAHDGTDLPYRMTQFAAETAARAGVSVDDALAAANDPDRVLRTRLDGTRAGHVRGDVSVIVDTVHGTIERVTKTVWVDASIGLLA